MKRILAILGLTALLLGLFACGETAPIETPTTLPTEKPTTEAPTTESPTTEPPTTEPPTTEPPSTEPPDPYTILDSYVWTSRATSGTIWAMAIVELENTGSENLYLSYGTMDLFDEEGHSVGHIGSVSGYPQILAPGETGYYCDVLALDISKNVPLTIEFEAPIVPTEKPALRYSFSDTELEETDFGGMLLSGRVENPNEESGELPCISAILFDEHEQVLGFICGYLEDPLEPGDSSKFSFTSFMLPTYLEREDITHYILFGYELEEAP